MIIRYLQSFTNLSILLLQVENLFYNMTAQRKTLQNSADDYSKIVDLLSWFAIHHMNVGFSCRKVGCLTLIIMDASLFAC